MDALEQQLEEKTAQLAAPPKRKRGRPRKHPAPPVAAVPVAPAPAPAQAISDGTVAEVTRHDAAEAAERAALEELVTWRMPKTATGDPVRIMNEVKTWEFWPGHDYRTTAALMSTALAQAGHHAQIESERFVERKGMQFLGEMGGPE